jgi:hypothetical protein
MMEDNTAEGDEVQHDGYNVVDEVSPDEWVEYDTEQHEEYVHIVTDPSNAELRCYRTTNEGYPNERVKTTIENVKIRTVYDDDKNRHKDADAKVLRGFYLTWMQAETFISWVEMLAHNRKVDTEARLLWYENNEKPSMEDSRVNDETITLRFTNLNDTKRRIQIQDSWQTQSNQMARYEDENGDN